MSCEEIGGCLEFCQTGCQGSDESYDDKSYEDEDCCEEVGCADPCEEGCQTGYEWDCRYECEREETEDGEGKDDVEE